MAEKWSVKQYFQILLGLTMGSVMVFSAGHTLLNPPKGIGAPMPSSQRMVRDFDALQRQIPGAQLMSRDVRSSQTAVHVTERYGAYGSPVGLDEYLSPSWLANGWRVNGSGAYCNAYHARLSIDEHFSGKSYPIEYSVTLAWNHWTVEACRGSAAPSG